MARTKKQFYFNSGVGPQLSYIHTDEDYMNVYCTVEFATSWAASLIALDLQRLTNGKWTTIASVGKKYLEGYGKQNRSFTNIAKKNASMRVKVKFYNHRNSSELTQTVYSNTWKR